MSKNSTYSSNRASLSNQVPLTRSGRSYALISAAVVILTLGFMFVDSPANTRLKIGYVDSSTILSLLPDAQAAQARLDTLVQDWSDTIDQMSKAYQAKVGDYTRQSGMMTRQARLSARNAIANLQQEITSYRQERVGTGGQLDSTREVLLKPIRARIYASIAEVAREEGMQFVFDKNDQEVFVLYADPYYDITYKVLDLLTRGAAD